MSAETQLVQGLFKNLINRVGNRRLKFKGRLNFQAVFFLLEVDMGRKPTTHPNLPKGMRARVRKRKSGKIVVYYFYDTGGKLRKEIPLGNDYVTAVREWAKLESAKLPENAIITFNVLADRFESEHAPTKTAGTQKAIRLSLKRLRQFFDGAPLDEIQPQHIARYLEWRKNSPVAANNDIQWFTAAWNQARSWGYTEKANPAAGVKRHIALFYIGGQSG